MEQGSSDWLNWRNRGLGGSDIAVVMGNSIWKTPFQLWQEKTGAVTLEQKESFAMKRGTDNEPAARAQVELKTGKTWPAELAVDDKKEYMRVSLDGRCGDEILEIKVPSEKLVDAIITEGVKAIPVYYMDQMQYQLRVTGAKRCLFFCFHPERQKMAEVWVERNEEYIAKIEKAADAFWKLVQTGEQPALTDKDYIELTDREFTYAAKEYQNILATIKHLEEKLEIVKEKILEQAKVHPAVKGGGIMVTGYNVKGNIDYAKIPELKLIDLEKFRKPSRKQFRITVQE